MKRNNVVKVFVWVIIFLELFKFVSFEPAIHSFISYSIYLLVLTLLILFALEYQKHSKELILISILIVVNILGYFVFNRSYLVVRWIRYVTFFSFIGLIYIMSLKQERVKETLILVLMKIISFTMFVFVFVFLSTHFYYVEPSSPHHYYHIVRLATAYKGVEQTLWMTIFLVTFIVLIVLYAGALLLKKPRVTVQNETDSEFVLLGSIIASYVLFMVVLSHSTRLITTYSGECYKVGVFLPLLTSLILIGLIGYMLYTYRNQKEEVIQATPYAVSMLYSIVFYLVYVLAYNMHFDGALYVYLLIGIGIFVIASLIILKVRYPSLRINPITILSILYTSLLYITLIKMIHTSFDMVCT